MKFSHSPVEVARHEMFAKKLDAAHPGLDPASSLKAARMLPDRPAESAVGTKGVIAGLSARNQFWPRPSGAAGRYDGTGAVKAA